MPPYPKNRRSRLTLEDQQRIQAHARQGLSRTAIAKALGFTYQQVDRCLLRFPAAPPLVEVLISREQFLLTQHFEQGRFSVEQLATYLGADPVRLKLELTGFKRMYARRTRTLLKFFADNQ